MGAISYFATAEDLSVVQAGMESNRTELQYQSALRQLEFLLKLQAQNPDDLEIRRRVKEAEKRVRRYECLLFKEAC